MGAARNIYKVARSVVFSAIILVAVVYLLLYILLSIPPVQNKIKDIAQTELTKLLGGEVIIDHLYIMPFNEAVVEGVKVMTPENELCLQLEKVGAGINLTKFITRGEIEITYGEIIGLDGRIWQKKEGEPLNIHFIIDAFAPKNKNKPKQKFDLQLRNVVLRKCRLKFDREWIPHVDIADKIDFNHLGISDLKADITFPRIKNDDFTIDLRRMALKVSGGLDLEKLAFKCHFTSTSLSVENLVIQLPATEIRPSDIVLSYKDYSDILPSILNTQHTFVLVDNAVTPSDLKGILPELAYFNDPVFITLEATGDAENVALTRLSVADKKDLELFIKGEGSNLRELSRLNFSIEDMSLRVGNPLIQKITDVYPKFPAKINGLLADCGDISVTGTFSGDMMSKSVDVDCHLTTLIGDISLTGTVNGITKGTANLFGEVVAENLNVGKLADKSNIGSLSADATFNIAIRGKDIDGEAELYVSDFILNGNNCDGIAIEVSKEGKGFTTHLTVDNSIALLSADAVGNIDGEDSELNVKCSISEFQPSLTGFFKNADNTSLAVNVSANLMGNSIDNVKGDINVSNFQFMRQGKTLILDHASILSYFGEDGRTVKLMSDWIDGEITGNFKVREIPTAIMNILAKTEPALFVTPKGEANSNMEVAFSFLLNPVNDIPEFFNLPFRLLVPVPVAGSIKESDSTAELSIDIPYLQQGKNKLVRDSRLNVCLNGEKGVMDLNVASTFPAKKGDLAIDVRVWGEEDNIFADLGWSNPTNDSFKGVLALGAKISRDEMTSKPEVNVEIKPSIFDIGPSRWNIDRGNITYDDNILTVDNFKIWHDSQFVAIDGVASTFMEDSISVRLADIDLDYIFDLLKINYVTFGGSATGDVTGKGVLGKTPEASTDNLLVKSLSYNGSVLGDGHIRSNWNNDEKKIGIYADILQEKLPKVKVDGGIWLTRDSLSFDIATDKAPIEFLKPFMSAFSSDIVGMASGKVKLFGTFKDIDLTGRIFADTIAMKLDFTNTWYHGSDSVFLEPGHIVIPSFRLYDRDGHSAILTGDLTHEYFHEPRFTFRISDARRLLCYDTNASMNPDWYGTIYGNGGAVVRGWPGMVNISVDMDLVNNSTFTFVLNDTQAAADYHFLTFSDRRKEEIERMRQDTVPDVLAAFQKKMEIENSTPSTFSLDIRASVNPSSLLTLVMDPIAGDKITARGNGAIQVEYESDSEEMQMFGKYTLDEGNYNFSLQDLILRDFSIRPGSSISFNGDPLNADLNITASYRVNTNLSDLDKSFSTDKDLARTNVPVDAMLMVNGEMQHPDITFDIELPTLTQDVERKVKSIISTDDMMSRQIIYLLALNRFYTPEYMGSAGNGSEWAAVASTTLSSQLSNMIGQLTDKFTLSPSFRSDKGDFSDLEVDVALSSRLLNNRLLLNGNFGYRDRNTSSTTFVGDFDLEYLLSRNGNLRLKAYNHFNDQNYYLREALTTQGIGVVYRRDFDNLFKFFRRKREEGGSLQDDTEEPESEELSGETEKSE